MDFKAYLQVKTSSDLMVENTDGGYKCQSLVLDRGSAATSGTHL